MQRSLHPSLYMRLATHVVLYAWKVLQSRLDCSSGVRTALKEKISLDRRPPLVLIGGAIEAIGLVEAYGIVWAAKSGIVRIQTQQLVQ